MAETQSRRLEDVFEFGFWWRTKDEKVQLAKDLSEKSKNLSRKEAQEIAPQVREIGWTFFQEHYLSKYTLVETPRERFYIHLSGSPAGRMVVEIPYLEDCTYGKTSDPSQLMENRKELIDI